MSTDELLILLEDWGLGVAMKEDGTPVVKGDKSTLTPELKRVLAFHREEIVKRLEPPPPTALACPPDGATIECLWDDGEIRSYPDGVWPSQPVAWRLPGVTAWHRLREAQPERWRQLT